MSQKHTKNDKITQQTNSRRQFIVKSVVGSAALSVPGKSVWGACSVSGAMSGNVSRMNPEQKCSAPTVIGGHSPGSWKDALNGQKLKAIFAVLQEKDVPSMPAAQPGSILWVAYEKHLETVIKTHSMAIDSRVLDDGITYVNGGVPLFNALDSNGGVDYNLAAVWLNVYFGFYPYIVSHDASESSRIIKANELVNNIAIYLFSESRIAMLSPESWGGLSLVDFNYHFEDESSTLYSLSSPEDNEENRTTPHDAIEGALDEIILGNGLGLGD